MGRSTSRHDDVDQRPDIVAAAEGTPVNTAVLADMMRGRTYQLRPDN
jgi:hypothetical protein